MSQTTLEHVEQSTTDEVDNRKLKHYFPKVQISNNLMSGSPMEAICGYVHTGAQQDPDKLPVCALCDEIMNIMYGRDDSDG